MLEIGTKVKIRKDLSVDEKYNGLRFHNGMNEHSGKVATIIGKPHYNENAYKINIDTASYDWSKTMFQVVS